MTNKWNHSTAMVIVGLLVLGGCQSRDTFADRLEARGTLATEIADDYRRGEKLIERGQDNVDQGKKLVRRGEESIDEGQDQIREGEALKARARSSYCEQVASQDPECA